MSTPALRARYLADTVSTASPARLLVMLYDRLLLDLSQGEAALRAGEREMASDRLIHAQDIVLELRASLDVTGWTGAPGLAQLYSFLLTELIRANVRQEPDRVAGCRDVVQPLAEAWRQAALGSERSGGTPGAGAPTTPVRMAAGLG
jgi:flagellar secretion chaperone FliS